MPTFTVYPKEGESFTIECTGIEFAAGQFTLYDLTDKLSKEGFLSPVNVTAIIPQPLPQPDIYNQFGSAEFQVFLRKRPINEPLVIPAYSFTVEMDNVKFYRNTVDLETMASKEVEIKGIYIAPSEVVAIIPADGLKGGR